MFCPSGRFVPMDVLSAGHFVPPDVLSLRTFCPYRCFVPQALWNVSGCYVGGRFVSGRFVTLDVLSPDVLSGHQFNYLRTYDLCLKKLPNLGILINSLVYIFHREVDFEYKLLREYSEKNQNYI
jgi:hypothetical protein